MLIGIILIKKILRIHNWTNIWSKYLLILANFNFWPSYNSNLHNIMSVINFLNKMIESEPNKKVKRSIDD